MFHFYFKLIDVDGAIMYIMQTKKNTVEIIPSIEAKIFWPTLIARFLESCVEWRMPPPVTNHIFDEIIEAEPQNVGPNRIQCEYLQYLLLFSLLVIIQLNFVLIIFVFFILF